MGQAINGIKHSSLQRDYERDLTDRKVWNQSCIQIRVASLDAFRSPTRLQS
jgi:hypothetical protein